MGDEAYYNEAEDEPFRVDMESLAEDLGVRLTMVEEWVSRCWKLFLLCEIVLILNHRLRGEVRGMIRGISKGRLEIR